MDDENWSVDLVRQAKKYKVNLSLGALELFYLLVKELRESGPYRVGWPNYKPFNSTNFHCHIKKGRPTYVCCWKIDKKKRLIEIYYAGTHEKADY